jgi:hypothetical protein
VERTAGELIGPMTLANRIHGGALAAELERETRAMFRTVWSGRSAGGPARLLVYAEAARAMATDLLELARSYRPDLIVFDPLAYAGPLVAKLTGVPAVRNLYGPDLTFFTRDGAAVPGWPALLEQYQLDPAEVDLLGTACIDPCPPSLQVAHTLGATPRIRTRYLPYTGLPDVPAWLSDQPRRPRICLTWGTSTSERLGQSGFLPGEILPGCVKLAEERDAELVLAITASQRALLPDLPEQTRIVESVPLDALLPTCQAVIHQGGAGTMLTALRHGLPQLVLPQTVDQASGACSLSGTGAGRTRPAAGLFSSDLVALGHELLDNPAYRTAAQHLRQEIADQPPPTGIVGQLTTLANRPE